MEYKYWGSVNNIDSAIIDIRASRCTQDCTRSILHYLPLIKSRMTPRQMTNKGHTWSKCIIEKTEQTEHCCRNSFLLPLPCTSQRVKQLTRKKPLKMATDKNLISHRLPKNTHWFRSSVTKHHSDSFHPHHYWNVKEIINNHNNVLVYLIFLETQRRQGNHWY